MVRSEQRRRSRRALIMIAVALIIAPAIFAFMQLPPWDALLVCGLFMVVASFVSVVAYVVTRRPRSRRDDHEQ